MRLIDADALELILNNAIEMMRTMAKALDSEDDPEIQMEIKAYTDILTGVKEQPTAQPEPAIPLQWIEAQIEWLKSLDNAFSTLTAGQISAMVNKWRDEQDE